MFRLLRRMFGLGRRRLLLCLSVGLLLLAAASLGLHYLALSHYQAAEQALDDDSLDEARNHIALCLTVWPRSAATHLLAARIARLGGDYPRAEAQLDQCSRFQKELSLEAHLEALLLRAEKGEVDDLEKDLLFVGDRDDSHARLIFESLGRAHLNLMNYGRALYFFRRCLDRQPDDIRALDGRGLTRERLRDRDAAKQDYQRALELSHGRADVRLRLALLCLDGFELEEAEPQLTILRKTHPDDPDVQLAWARCKFLQGKEEESRQLLDSLLVAHPDDQTALSLRGKLALAHDNPAEAEGYFRRALKKDHSNPAAYFTLYDSLRAQPGREADAEEVLKEHERAQADFERLHQLLTEDLRKSGESPDALAEVGELCLRLDREQMGLHWLFAALKKDPDLKRAHKDLAEYYDEKGDAEAAKRHRLLGE